MITVWVLSMKPVLKRVGDSIVLLMPWVITWDVYQKLKVLSRSKPQPIEFFPMITTYQQWDFIQKKYTISFDFKMAIMGKNRRTLQSLHMKKNFCFDFLQVQPFAKFFLCSDQTSSTLLHRITDTILC